MSRRSCYMLIIMMVALLLLLPVLMREGVLQEADGLVHVAYESNSRPDPQELPTKLEGQGANLVSSLDFSGNEDTDEQARSSDFINLSPPTTKQFVPCPTDRFLIYGKPARSRHANHMMSFVAALELGKKLNRTVVLPPTTGKKRDPALDSVFDFSELQKVYCWVLQSEFLVYLQKQKLENPLATERGCILMHTLGKLQDLKLCTVFEEVHEIRFKPLAAAAKRMDDLPLLEIPVLLKLGETMDVSCVWSLIRPSPRIREGLRRARTNMFQNFPYVGIHLRNVENNCLRRVHENKELEGEWKALQTTIEAQCHMSPAYVERYLVKFDMRNRPFFIADDRQRPELTESLVHMGGVPFKPTKKYSQALDRYMLDFWLLVHSSHFVGNQISGFSMNVCNARRGLGKPCDTFLFLSVPEHCEPVV